MDYLITADKQAEFSLGTERDGYHFAFDRHALRNFLTMGAAALAELEGQTNANQGDGDRAAVRGTAANAHQLVTAGERSA